MAPPLPLLLAVMMLKTLAEGTVSAAPCPYNASADLDSLIRQVNVTA